MIDFVNDYNVCELVKFVCVLGLWDEEVFMCMVKFKCVCMKFYVIKFVVE